MALSDSEIKACMLAGITPRMQRIDDHQRYYDGTFYDTRPDFFASDDTPLRARKPCIIYPAVRNAVQSFTALCLGDGKFPTITSGTSEDDAAFDDRFGLNESQSKDLDAVIRKIVDQTRLDAVSQQIFESALAAGTGVPVVGIVKGRLRVSQLDPKVCTPTFSEDDPDEVVKLEVSFRYLTDDTWDAGERKFVKRVWQYRRVIDATYDTLYKAIEITNPEDRPVPTSEVSKFEHHFGFCPVVWWRANATVSDLADLDGRPIHWGLLSLVDAINLGLSQRFRAALYSGDPQMCEFGVIDGEAHYPMGRTADVATPGNDPSGWRSPLNERKTSGGVNRTRKKGAGVVWTYESPDASVKLIGLEAGALEAIASDVKDNIKKLREALGHVYIDPEDLTGSGDISGKTLAFLYSTQIARCNRLREDFWRKCLQPVLNMLFRVVIASGKGIYLAGAPKLQALAKAKFYAKVGNDNADTWFGPTLKAAWGDYFPTSDMDEATRISSTLNALNSPRPIITLETAVTAVKAVYPDIHDPGQYTLKLLAEAKERQAQALEQMKAMGGPAAPGDKKPGDDKVAPAVSLGAKAPKPNTKKGSSKKPADDAVEAA